MKTEIMTRRVGPIGKALCVTAVLLMALFGVTQVAEANSAANTTIRNTVTVNYDDTAGTAQTAVTAQVDITVNLVEAAPTLSAPADQSTDPATAAVYNYTITSNANGPDIYDLTVDDLTESAGIGTPTASTAVLSVASIDLGASTVAAGGPIAASGNTAITVPSDDANSSVVNGIEDGDFVVINGEVFEVESVVDNGGSPGTSTITVVGNGTLTAISPGDQIGERGSFTLTVTPGTVSATTSPTIDVTIGAQDDAGVTTKVTDDTQTTVTVASLIVTKEVSTDGGNTFVASASANPGATLTYRVTVTNGGGGDAASVVITDPKPAFTTYVGSSAKADTTTGTAYGAAATDLTDLNSADDGYDYNVTASDTATYSIGTISAGNSVLLFFQVTID